MNRYGIAASVFGAALALFAGLHREPAMAPDNSQPSSRDTFHGTTALVITDPQNDFLSPDGVTWGLVGESVTENHTVENLDRLFSAAKDNGMPVFISPHYYFPHDHKWLFEGKLEEMMHEIGMFDRKAPLSRMSLFP